MDPAEEDPEKDDERKAIAGMPKLLQNVLEKLRKCTGKPRFPEETVDEELAAEVPRRLDIVQDVRRELQKLALDYEVLSKPR